MLHGRLLLVEEFPEAGNISPSALGDSPVTLHAYVEDVDATFAEAVAACATPVHEPDEAFLGDRYAEFVDPTGHRWSIATPTEDQAPTDQDINASQWMQEHPEPM